MFNRCNPERFSEFGNGRPFFMFYGILIVFLIIAAIIVISRKKGSSNNLMYQRNTNDTALKILQERYAKGEIDDEEYLNKKNLLNK